MLKLFAGVAMAIALMIGPQVAKSAENPNCLTKEQFLVAAKSAEPREIELASEADNGRLLAITLKELNWTVTPGVAVRLSIAELKGGNIGIVVVVNGCYSGKMSFMIDAGTFEKWLGLAQVDLDWRAA